MKDTSPLVSVIIGSNGHPADIFRCLDSILAQSYKHIEIVVLDDNSGNDLCAAVSENFSGTEIRCIHSNKSLGVAGGRNLLINKAKGNILVTLDDDAVFMHRDSLDRIVRTFNANSNVGLLAFKIVDIVNNVERSFRVPFGRRVIKKSPDIINTSRYVSYYLGGGHAARREVYDKCGLYQADLFFGLEELDLAYRVVDNGYSILYFPEVFVEHHPHPDSLKRVRGGYMYYHARNRIWVNYKYLPPVPFVTSTFFWCTVLLFSSILKREFVDTIRGILDGFKGTERLERNVINKKAVKYLKRNYGRLYK